MHVYTHTHTRMHMYTHYSDILKILRIRVTSGFSHTSPPPASINPPTCTISMAVDLTFPRTVRRRSAVRSELVKEITEKIGLQTLKFVLKVKVKVKKKKNTPEIPVDVTWACLLDL